MFVSYNKVVNLYKQLEIYYLMQKNDFIIYFKMAFKIFFLVYYKNTWEIKCLSYYNKVTDFVPRGTPPDLTMPEYILLDG